MDYGSYFVINEGRQYGKTTQKALEEYMKEDYFVLSLDFQQSGTEDFANAQTFTHVFVRVVLEAFGFIGITCDENLLHPLKAFGEFNIMDAKKSDVKYRNALCQTFCWQKWGD